MDKYKHLQIKASLLVGKDVVNGVVDIVPKVVVVAVVAAIMFLNEK